MYLNSIVIFLVYLCSSNVFSESSIEEEGSGRYTIEGRVFPLSDYQIQTNWQANTRIHINGGEFLGFVKRDGSFAVHNLPSGSYIVEALNPEYSFEPVRVEINQKGKFRARKVNHIQTSLVVSVPYPLRLKALGKTRYFQQREQWRVTDFLFNPMILMMVVPLIIIMILPKMLNDPETKKEMEQMQSLTKFELPEMSDMVTNFLSGGAGPGTSAQQSKQKQKIKKRQ
ncbi:hypothetical protein HHI36_000636 [Cryptolaemus montrouzieri]|uniref:ER membrane protein complex subunit 7 beta-sandwich domain-containing protein n=1 Tax=Cryptolaemus montrouzieri TaxID=559131 RepID=A0ABD2P548_9CUCU